jgi:hypothetical protein
MIELAQLTLPGTTTVIKDPLQNSNSVFHFTNLASIPSNALAVLFPLAGAILLAMLMWGGFEFITSFGDPKKAALGKTRITNAIIGIIIIFTAYWIVQLVDYVFKLGIYTPQP